ncbi:sodium-coupled neutral amino acid transporter 2 [Etheostoma cragini]|uniref:sodium-coupled neutral amino acid transporter 2 n=1 Tax=Etheostoma cragini TaxID=417921 RepID=UPI00155EC4CD|nr:sodium-coupled neutral amino acid transporter 2 [Etheostoma cragini]XP_034719275.1 sodium-coupled neutral amino acid transporter 2 [Etheostoma cragini]
MTAAKTEMSRFNISHEEDTSSSNSNEYTPYPDCPRKVPLGGQFSDIDGESQNFLPEHNLQGKKKYETEYHQGNASFGMSVFNLGNAIMGSGILGLSYAMANTGIALFVILLMAVAIFSLYSVHLLLKTANEGGALVYEQLGYKAFGMPGKLAASISITMQNIGAMSSYLYIVKYELPIVIESFMGVGNKEWYTNGDYLVLLVTVAIILPLSLLRNLGYLGYTSGLSLLCMVFFLIVVIIKKFQIPCPLSVDVSALNETLTKVLNTTLSHLNTTAVDYSEDACTPKYFVFNSQTVYAVPILSFAFVCHPAILPMYEELKDRSRRKMQGVANVSFLAMFIMYLLAALFGYLTFNVNVEPELLHTYSKIYKADVVLLIVRLAVLTAVTLTVPVVLFPIRTSVNHLLCASKEFSWIRHTIITIALLAGTNLLVIFVPTIRDIFGFIGASAAAMLIFILPSAFYIKLVKKESMKSVQKIGATAFLLCGIVVMIGSMSLIILDWIHNASPSQDAPGNGH